MPSQKQQRSTNEYPCNTREDFLLFEYSALTENDKQHRSLSATYFRGVNNEKESCALRYMSF